MIISFFERRRWSIVVVIVVSVSSYELVQIAVHIIMAPLAKSRVTVLLLEPILIHTLTSLVIVERALLPIKLTHLLRIIEAGTAMLAVLLPIRIRKILSLSFKLSVVFKIILMVVVLLISLSRIATNRRSLTST